jgi:CHASE3 domain sensor protein
MRLRTLLVLVFGIAFAIVQARSLWLVHEISAVLADASALIERAGNTREAISRVRAVALDMEAGTWAWVATRDPGAREHYERASRERIPAVEELARLVRDDREASWVVAQLRAALDAWQREVAAPLLASAPVAAPAPAIEGRRRMDAIRAYLDTLDRLLTTRRNIVAAALVEKRRDLSRETLTLGGGIGLVLLLAALATARSVAVPLGQLVNHAGRVARGDFEPISVDGVREVRDLAGALSEMAAQLAADRDRERSFAAMVAGLAAGGDVATVASTALESLVRDQHAVAGVLWLAPEPAAPLECVASIAIDRTTLPAGAIPWRARCAPAGASCASTTSRTRGCGWCAAPSPTPHRGRCSPRRWGRGGMRWASWSCWAPRRRRGRTGSWRRRASASG